MNIDKIYLSNCSIRTIQEGSFSDSRIIDLSYNQLEDFNGDVFISDDPNTKTPLYSLNLKNNKIKDIDKFFKQNGRKFNNLDFIDLSFNNLTMVDLDLILPNCKKLNLNDNKIEGVIFNNHTKNIYQVDLRNNFLSSESAELPEEINVYCNLFHKSIEERKVKSSSLQKSPLVSVFEIY